MSTQSGPPTTRLAASVSDSAPWQLPRARCTLTLTLSCYDGKNLSTQSGPTTANRAANVPDFGRWQLFRVRCAIALTLVLQRLTFEHPPAHRPLVTRLTWLMSCTAETRTSQVNNMIPCRFRGHPKMTQDDRKMTPKDEPHQMWTARATQTSMHVSTSVNG